MSKATGFVLVSLLCLAASSASAENQIPLFEHPSVTTAELLAQAKLKNPERVAFAEKIGARVVPTPDGKSFFLVWYPKNTQSVATRPPMIVTFSGHGSFAYDELFLWQPLAEKHGFGIIAVQWWLGQGEKLNDYYQMHEIYPYLESLLRHEGIKPGTILAHGFSRGSANIYSLAYLDKTSGNHFFGAILANAGKLEDSFPENRPLLNAGTDAFGGTHWLLYSGKNDPGRGGWQGMQETNDWLIAHGGTVDLFIKDPNGDHGGFHRNPQNIEAALRAFEKITAASNPSLR